MKTIDVCGIDFKLVECESIGRSFDEFGRCDAKDGTISIDKNMPEQIKNQTIIHEWIHCVLDLYGVPQDEKTVAVLANELHRKGFKIKPNER